MKTFKKIAIVGLLFTVVFYILVIMAVSHIIKGVEDEKSSYSKNVGKHIVIEKDTLMIINYSTIKGTYSLSNGKEIDKVIIEKSKYLK